MKKVLVYMGNHPLQEELLNALHLGAFKAKVEFLEEAEKAENLFKNEKFDIFLSCESNYELLTLHKTFQPENHRTLITSLPMEVYSKELKEEENKLLDHIISRSDSLYLTALEITVTIKKIFTGDIFGIEKYLKGQNENEYREVPGAFAREQLNAGVMDFANRNRLGNYRAKLAFGISEELLMNATYDAPSSAGIEKYKNIRLTPDLVLDPEHRSILSYGCDGSILAISVKDPFGLLEKKVFDRYLKKVLVRNESTSIIDTKKEGAGLGLFKILFSSHSLICNVKAGAYTEVISLLDLNAKVKDFSKMPRSIHFFQTE